MENDELLNPSTSRRTFLAQLSAATAGLSLLNTRSVFADKSVSVPQAITKPMTQDALGELLPLRRLGRQNEFVTMLCLGGSHHEMLRSAREEEEAIEVAIEGGVRFFDTAAMYGRGRSEELFGEYLTPKYRDHVYIMTKSHSRDAAGTQAHLEQSLRSMKLDQIDLWQMHTLESPSDVDRRIDNGVLDVFLKAKADGKVRHLGFTGHTSMPAHLHLLEELAKRGLVEEFTTAQMPINVLDPGYESFIENVVPQLVKHQIAPLAMKTVVFGQLFGKPKSWKRDRRPDVLPKLIPEKVSHQDAMNFVYSLPITSAVVGFDTVDQLRENIAIAKQAAELDEAKRTEIVEAVAEFAGPEIEFYKRMV